MSKETNLSVVEIQGVRCYIDKLGAAWINAEDAARGLGFVDVHLKKDFATSGEKYETVRWARVNDYLREFGYDKEVGKDDFIPESIFYLLAMKANNEAAKNFQRKIAFEIMPSLRKYGYYALPRQDKIKYPILDDTKRKVLFEMVEDYIKYLGCVYDIGANEPPKSERIAGRKVQARQRFENPLRQKERTDSKARFFNTRIVWIGKNIECARYRLSQRNNV